jgi:hypothetical protein
VPRDFRNFLVESFEALETSLTVLVRGLGALGPVDVDIEGLFLVDQLRYLSIKLLAG